MDTLHPSDDFDPDKWEGTEPHPTHTVLSADLPIALYERLERAANTWFDGDIGRACRSALYVALSGWEGGTTPTSEPA